MTMNIPKKYRIDAYIPKDIKVLFILESPHVQELKYGMPVSGGSGKTMTRAIFGEMYDLPLGRLLKEEASNERVGQIGLLNICPYPMQASAYGDDLSTFISDVEALEEIRSGFTKKSFKHSGAVSIQAWMEEKFAQKMATLYNQKLTIVPCGKFAEHYVGRLKEKSPNWTFINGVPHPSYNSWAREVYIDKINEIRTIIK
jgi:hypothetical protein